MARTDHQQGQSMPPGSCPCSDAEMNPFCKSLNEQTRCKLCQASRQLLIKRGAMIPVSEFASEMLITKSGVVASALLTENGKTQGAFIAQEGYIANIIRVAGRRSAMTRRSTTRTLGAPSRTPVYVPFKSKRYANAFTRIPNSPGE